VHRSPALEAILLTDVELAKYYGISIATIRKWRLTGKGPRWIKLCGTLVRYPIEDADAWLASQPGGGEGGRPAALVRRNRTALQQNILSRAAHRPWKTKPNQGDLAVRR